VLALASLDADGIFIKVPLLKPIGQMVKHSEDDDDFVYKLWLTQIVYYHIPLSNLNYLPA
jgi:hypothetical protein